MSHKKLSESRFSKAFPFFQFFTFFMFTSQNQHWILFFIYFIFFSQKSSSGKLVKRIFRPLKLTPPFQFLFYIVIISQRAIKRQEKKMYKVFGFVLRKWQRQNFSPILGNMREETTEIYTFFLQFEKMSGNENQENRPCSQFPRVAHGTKRVSQRCGGTFFVGSNFYLTSPRKHFMAFYNRKSCVLKYIISGMLIWHGNNNSSHQPRILERKIGNLNQRKKSSFLLMHIVYTHWSTGINILSFVFICFPYFFLLWAIVVSSRSLSLLMQ